MMQKWQQTEMTPRTWRDEKEKERFNKIKHTKLPENAQDEKTQWKQCYRHNRIKSLIKLTQKSH